MMSMFTKIFHGSAPKCEKCLAADLAVAHLTGVEIETLVLRLIQQIHSIKNFPSSERDARENWRIVSEIEKIAKEAHGDKIQKSLLGWVHHVRLKAERADGHWQREIRISAASIIVRQIQFKATSNQIANKTEKHISVNSKDWTGR